MEESTNKNQKFYLFIIVYSLVFLGISFGIETLLLWTIGLFGFRFNPFGCLTMTVVLFNIKIVFICIVIVSIIIFVNCKKTKENEIN